jgi:hypothetical protein
MYAMRSDFEQGQSPNGWMTFLSHFHDIFSFEGIFVKFNHKKKSSQDISPEN